MSYHLLMVSVQLIKKKILFDTPADGVDPIGTLSVVFTAHVCQFMNALRSSGPN